MSKWIDRLFVFAVFCVLLLCLGKALFLPDEINLYENRTANQFQPFTIQSYLDGSFQDSVEAAMMDQIPLAEVLKKSYNNTTSALQEIVIRPILDAYPDRYISFKSLRIYGGDYITYAPEPINQPGHDGMIARINSTVESHPEVAFYAYYLERDVDINFETGEKSGAYEYVKERLNLGEENLQRLEISSFEDYKEYFYKSDHHWNHKGSYAAYVQIAELLGIPEEEWLTPVEEVNLGLTMVGSKANTSGTEIFNDRFTAYRFDFPEMTVTQEGIEGSVYGAQDAFLSGRRKDISYGAFYGSDCGEAILDTNRPELGNILVLGNSYDNALLCLLASHYNQTYSIDMRHYERVFSVPFRFSEYIEKNKIDTVLIVGDTHYYYSSTAYAWED